MRRTRTHAGADLYITTRCGFSCSHCFMGDLLNSGSEMSLDDVARILRFLKNQAFREVTLLGGEPFQHPDIAALARLVVSEGFLLRIVTNGYRAAYRTLLAGRVPTDAAISFSIDGGTDVTHDSVRRKGSFEELLKAARLAKSLGHETSGIASIGKRNAPEVFAILDLCSSLGFSTTTVHHVTARGNAEPDAVLDRSGWAVVLGHIAEYAKSSQMEIRTEDPYFELAPAAPLHCALREGRNWMFFPDGRVFSCLLFLDTPSGHAMKWNGVSMSASGGLTGENAAMSGNVVDSCPAARLEPQLYPASESSRIACVYDKVMFSLPIERQGGNQSMPYPGP